MSSIRSHHSLSYVFAVGFPCLVLSVLVNAKLGVEWNGEDPSLQSHSGDKGAKQRPEFDDKIKSPPIRFAVTQEVSLPNEMPRTPKRDTDAETSAIYQHGQAKKLDALSAESRNALARLLLSRAHEGERLQQSTANTGLTDQVTRAQEGQNLRPNETSAEVATDLTVLAWIIINHDADHVTGEALLRRALEIRKFVFGTENVAVAESLCLLGDLFARTARFDLAESYCRSGFSLYSKLPETASYKHTRCGLGLAGALNGQQRFAESELLYRQTSARFQDLLDEGHPEASGIRGDLIATENSLALLLMGKPSFVEAESLLRKCIARIKTSNDPAFYHGVELQAKYSFALLMHNKGNFAEAEKSYRDVLQAQQRDLGRDHPAVASVLNTLGTLRMHLGDYERAEEYVRESLEMRVRILREDHPAIADSMLRLALIFLEQGDLLRAESQFHEAMQRYIRCYGKKHARVASCLTHLGKTSWRRGEFATAEEFLRDAIKLRREISGEQHPAVAKAMADLARVYVSRGAFVEAESTYREAIRILEQHRDQILGREDDRALYAGVQGLMTASNGLAEVLVRQGRYGAALEVSEVGRSRTFLDLLARSTRGPSHRGDNRNVIGPEADKSHFAENDEESDLHSQPGQHSSSNQAVPLAVIRDALRPGELLLAFTWTKDVVIVYTVPPRGSGEVNARLIADGQTRVDQLTKVVREFRTHVSNRPQLVDSLAVLQVAHDLKESLFPEGILPAVQSADRVVVVVEGPLRTIPMELLWMEGATSSGNTTGMLSSTKTPQIVYADSATIFVNRRTMGWASHHKRDSKSLSALVLADPQFSASSSTQPEHGAFVAHVEPEGNAALAGLKSGDIVLSYAGQPIRDRKDLLRLLSRPLPESLSHPDDRIPLIYWRDDSACEVLFPPGDPGIQLSKLPAADARRWVSFKTRSVREISTEIVAKDQLQLHGGSLAALPGTRMEADAIAKIIRTAGGSATVLLGEEATLAELESRVHGKRFVHLATHGLTGSSRYPLESSLALTPPATHPIEDVGYLTLDRLLRTWHGKLDECELVVLSACDTQNGVVRGDSHMTLPWGFMFAGTPSVLASLWKVDDVAVVLLMSRFYEDILGEYQNQRDSLSPGTEMSKIQGLSEAKQWLRSLSANEITVELTKLGLPITRDSLGVVGTNSERSEISDERPGPPIERRGDQFDFSHPYYWGAFVLIGDPD